MAPPLRALLGESVDYAGLFPPAGLALKPALDNYAAYARGSDAWMLGCFVLPVAKLTEAGGLLAGGFDAQSPLQLSALGSKATSAGEFLDHLRAAVRALDDFQDEHGATVAVDQIEAPLPPAIAPGPALDSLLLETAGLLAGRSWRAFWEVPFTDDLPTLLSSIARQTAGAARPFGAKLRTGGLEAGAFPSPTKLAGALVAARDAGVALKFTAGLHHPFRRFDVGMAAHMHGFVNVFVAGVLLHQRRIDAALTRTLLEDETPENFRFDADGLGWRDFHVTTRESASAREFITSFGSCSFDEPRDDLRAAGLLP